MDPPGRSTNLEILPGDACTVCEDLRGMLTGHTIFRRQVQGSLETCFETSCLGHGSLFQMLRKDIIQQLSEYCETQDNDTTNDGGDNAGHTRIGESSAREEDSSESGKSQEGQWNGRDRKPSSGVSHVELSFLSYSDGGGQHPLILVVLTNSPATPNWKRLFWEPVMAKSCDEPQTPGFGRVLDPEWVDLELARRWKRECFALHKDKCHNPLKVSSISPAWVIDTAEKCIIPGAHITEYVALSYRWGVSAGFRTTRHLLKDLQEPGAFSQRSRFGNSIAPIIQHAIELTQAIDERYLWVDAVCIVQDDETHLTTQLRLMGAIYATAKLTIVASDGDAADGILGLKGISSPRRFDQKVTPVFESDKVIFRRHSIFESGASPYFDRGWTFQEFFLSQRRLIFADGQIHWHCSCADWREELITPVSTCAEQTEKLAVDIDLSTLLTGRPDFKALNVILAQYNARHLTFPEDAPSGISGLLSLFSRTFEGGFLFGLPETAFDSALMWHLSSKYLAGMRKRQDYRRTKLLALASRLPSWSWVGWQTHGDNLCVLDEETFKVRDYVYQGSWTIPITQWFTHETPEAVEKRPIQSHWFRFRDKFNSTNCELPQGWTREKPEEVLGPDWRDKGYDRPPQGLGEYVYKHAALDGEYFWLPVPIATDNQESNFPGPSSQTSYISCNTKRGWFTATQFPINHFSDSQLRGRYNLTTVGLLDGNGEYCGRLYIQEADDILRFPEANSGSTCEVEIVAICRRREMTSEGNSWRPYGEEDEDIERYVFKDVFGVLWIEWIDGVAYRRASGVVGKDEWESHNLEDVHLVMG